MNKVINVEIISFTTVMKKIRKEELKIEVSKDKKHIKRLYIEEDNVWVNIKSGVSYKKFMQ